jgi:L-threonylcarbamoyladenylate synthase
MEKDLLNSLEVLMRGGTILYPTDTIWGIGCDATSQDAVDNLLKIKGRSDEKGLLILVDDPERLSEYVAEIPDIAWELVAVTEEPLTIVYPEGINLPANVLHNDGSVGIRVTVDTFCRELIRRFGRPVISTSANLSGQPFPSVFAEISEAIKSGVDYIVKWRQDDLTVKNPSTILKLGLKGEIEIIRPGIPGLKESNQK